MNDVEELTSHQRFEILNALNDFKIARTLQKALCLDSLGDVGNAELEKTILNGEAKSIRPDVFLSMENGVLSFDLQMRDELDLKERILYYGMTNIIHMLPSGGSYKEIRGKCAVTVFICTFDMENFDAPVYNIDGGDGIKNLLGSNLFRIIIINKKAAMKGEDLLAKLLRDFERDRYEELETEEFREAYRTIENTPEGEDFMEKGLNAIMKEAERRGRAIGEARGEARGKAEGKVEGRAEGKAEVKTEMITNMIRDGVSDDKIAKYSNTLVSDIASMRRKLMAAEA